MAGFGLFWILVLVAAAFVIFVVARKPGGPGPSPSHQSGDSAEEILRQRFARGEIDREEYEDRLRMIRR